MSTARAVAMATVVAAGAWTAGCAGRPAAVQAAPAPQQFISSAEAHRLVEKEGTLLLDVRTREEFAAGHLPGAVNLPVQELPQRTGELGAPPKKVVVYCHSGRRATQAAGILGEKGYDVANLGPMSAWNAK